MLGDDVRLLLDPTTELSFTAPEKSGLECSVEREVQDRVWVLNILSTIIEQGATHFALVPYLACFNIELVEPVVEKNSSLRCGIKGTFTYKSKDRTFIVEELWERNVPSISEIISPKMAPESATVMIPELRNRLGSVSKSTNGYQDVQNDLHMRTFISRFPELSFYDCFVAGVRDASRGGHIGQGHYSHLAYGHNFNISSTLSARSDIDNS